MGVDPITVPEQRVPFGALIPKADLLINASGPRVEVVHLQLHPMQAHRERVIGGEAGRLGAEPSAVEAWSLQQHAEGTRAVVHIQVHQDRFAGPRSAAVFDDRPVDPVRLLAAGGVPLLQLGDAELAVRAGEPDGLGIHGAEFSSVTTLDRAQSDQRSGQRRLGGE
jgi:hypothetical protein